MVKSKKFGSVVFDIFNHLFLIGLALACILPMFHILAVSLSDRYATGGGYVTFLPLLVKNGVQEFGYTFESYRKVIQSGAFLNGFVVSTVRTVGGTLLNLLVSILTAYPLTRTEREFRGRKYFVWFIVATMVFGGGLIPFYLVVRNMGLLYNVLSLIIPFGFSAFNVIILMNFFKEVPRELEDAAAMDGASHWQILYHVYLPLSLPALATLGLFTAVFHWNDWFFGMIFMRASDYPLQTFLRTVVIQMNTAQVARDTSNFLMFSDQSLRAAAILITTLPILVVYPFVQRYFIHGVKLGGVKG